jgi:signal transduction histidine kinase
MVTLFPHTTEGGETTATLERLYEHEETRELVALVNDAAELVRTSGDAAFSELGVSGSRWRHEETYIFVLDPEGNMLVHPDPAMEGRNELDLKDISGKPVIRGLIGAVMTFADKTGGWYHYQWPVPGGLLPRWKSSYVRLAKAPSGKSYVVGCGMYNDRMDKGFVVDMVTDAVGQLEEHGRAAFAYLRDPTASFMAKDAYIFVLNMNGVQLVNPAFPNLEGKNLSDVKDTRGTYLVREMLEMAQANGSGWVDYMWPKPGESVSTRKSTYVSRAKLDDQSVVVACGVYLADAPKEVLPTEKMTAPELMSLVREGAALLEEQGEKAYPEFRKKGSKWFRDDTYFFVWSPVGTRVFHAANPADEGRNESGLKDILGRPIGQMILEAGASPSGEGWVHYMYPEPQNIFPIWKSTFVKRVTFPSGKQYITGCGIYGMKMDKTFIEDVVDHAADLIAELGKEAFDRLRDKTGPFVFMDTYVFVQATDGTELVNPAQPALEGRNLMDLRDVKGKAVAQEEIEAALKEGSAWLECYWFKPGDNVPVRKLTYVRKVQSGNDIFIAGSGIYLE